MKLQLCRSLAAALPEILPKPLLLHQKEELDSDERV